MPASHEPLRPLWICRSDAQPWPCAKARLALTQQYADRPVALCVRLGMSLAEAVRDLHVLDPGSAPDPAALGTRFLGWVPGRPTA